MKAITVATLGGPEVLQLAEIAVPEPTDGALLVKVQAAGVNYADLMMRSGTYPSGPQPVFVPGLEVAGTVATGPRQGETVVGFTGGGGYAEYALVAESLAFAAPPGLSMVESAALLVNGLTAYFALWMADLKPDERVLIHAAAGGVGTMAVQLAREMGAETIATASTDEKLKLAKRLGAEHTVNYTRESVEEAVSALGGDASVDVVLEVLGGAAMERDLNLLRTLGRMVFYGDLSGEGRAVNPGLLLARNISLHGLYLGGLLADRSRADQAWSEILAYVRRGKLKPVIGGQFPLAEAAEAHRLLQDRRSTGKLVLIP